MAQNPAITPSLDAAIAINPMTFQERSLTFPETSLTFPETPVVFRPGASGCFSRVLWVFGFFVLLILVVYGTQWLFAAAGGF